MFSFEKGKWWIHGFSLLWLKSSFEQCEVHWEGWTSFFTFPKLDNLNLFELPAFVRGGQKSDVILEMNDS